jgi:hypothetical protein
MYSFFVLGLVPGTNFQITFRAWINIISLTLTAACLIYLRRLRRLNTPAPSLAASAHQLLPDYLLLTCVRGYNRLAIES